ncbi:MAG: HRDC domain-containing protein [Rubricoccaceae bacterium]
MIATADALDALIARARRAGAVALDTEFVWERSYYPALGVVQLGLGEDDVHLIDAVALAGSLGPLGALLEDADVEKVLHDAGQDLQILARATGARPRTIFDTQRAAGFVGLPVTVSLQELIRHTAGVTLDKGETRTDWLRRPLSPEQVRYAEDDVRYLLAARDRLLADAAARGRDAWVRQEMARYEDAALYAPADVSEAVTRIKARGVAQLPAQGRAVLRALAAWREREAQALDRTRRLVLPDEALVELARRRPHQARELAALGLTDRQRHRYAEGLLAAVAEGEAAPAEAAARRGRPGPEDERRAAVLLLAQAFVAGRCATEGIDPALVAPKATLRRLVDRAAQNGALGPAANGPASNGPASNGPASNGPASNGPASNGPAANGDDAAEHDAAEDVLVGWRRDFIGADLEQLLEGELAVRLDGPRGWPRRA